MTEQLILGTRGSALALTQARWVAATLETCWPDLEVRLEVIQTAGDRDLSRPLAQFGATGIFTSEVERAVLEGSVDFAVHSLKDLPVLGNVGLAVAALPIREDPRDALVLPVSARCAQDVTRVLSLPVGARVGTGSVRRRSQLRHARPDLKWVDLRGNVDTRLRKLDRGEFEACVLAAAGLRRLSVDRQYSFLDIELCMPDPGQGALAVQAAVHRTAVLHRLAAIDDPETRACVTAERAVLHALGGGCSLPLGALATSVVPDRIRLRAVVTDLEGEERIDAELTGQSGFPEELGRRLADELIRKGAERMLTAKGS